LCNWKGAQSYKKLPEAIVPKVGHGPKMGQYGFDRACFSVVYLFLLCFIAHLYETNGGTDMEVLACFRPVFFQSAYKFFFLWFLNRTVVLYISVAKNFYGAPSNSFLSCWFYNYDDFYFHVRRTNGSIGIPSKFRSWAKHISWLH